MSLPHYPVFILEPERVRAEEFMGSKTKYWIDLPEGKEQWLFKYARVHEWGTAGEHWAEKVAAEVAALMELPHADVELAELNGRYGSLSRKFRELSNPGMQLVHGNVLLPGHVYGYDREKRQRQSDHTLFNILRVIDHTFGAGPDRKHALDLMMGYLILDGLVLNTDRHHENWALIQHTSVFGLQEHRMAPTFDHASSLGRELTSGTIGSWKHDKRAIERYARRGRTPIYRSSSDSKGLSPLDVVDLALRLKGEHVYPWLVRLRTLDPQALVDIMARVPPQIIGENNRIFAMDLLRYTLNHLQQLNA